MLACDDKEVTDLPERITDVYITCSFLVGKDPKYF